MTFGGFGFGGGNQVRVEIVGDATRLKRATDQAERDVRSFSTKTKRQVGSTATFIKGALVAGAGAAIVRFGQDAIQSFSSLEQAMGGTEAVFGEVSATIDEFARTSAQAIGLSESEFRTATTLIGGQLKRMTGDVRLAAEQSIELTRVAADLAATYGGTTKQAVEALGSALRGEADPAERFNLNLKVGAVNAKALELGLAETTSEITDQARAQAILALITEQSADAQGQFAREADTVAGKLQRAEASMEDTKATLGSLVAGPFSEFVGLASDAVTVLDGLAGAISGVTDAGFSFINFAEAAFPPTKLLTDGLSALAGWFSETEDSASGAAAAVSQLTDAERSARRQIGALPTRPSSPQPSTSTSVSPNLIRHTGGRVNAPLGQEVPTTLLGGETVMPAGGNGGGNTFNVFVLTWEDFVAKVNEAGIEAGRLGL